MSAIDTSRVSTDRVNTGTASDVRATAVRLVAAACVLIGGIVHLQLWADGYRDVPNANLGRSFIANGVASVVVATALLVRRDALLRLGGIAVSVGTLVAFALSRTDRGIFGFTEQGLQPSPQAALTLVAEIGAALLLASTFLPRVGAGRAIPVRIAAPIGALAALAAIVLPVAADRDVSQAAEESATTAAPGAVTIAGFAFGPPTLDVAAGTTVTWTNEDGFAHTVTASDGSFASDDIRTGETFTVTFDEAGSFTYVCAIHPSMSGSVVVTP